MTDGWRKAREEWAARELRKALSEGEVDIYALPEEDIIYDEDGLAIGYYYEGEAVYEP